MIQREAFLQEALIRFAREAIACPHVVLGFDRAQARGKMSHLYQARRGLRAGTADTCTFTGAVTLWWEAKAKGNKPDDNQLQFAENVKRVGHAWSWGTTIAAYLADLRLCGIPVVVNADFIAMHHDAMVESRIAKAEAATSKKAVRTKAVPRYAAGKSFVRRARAKGIIAG